MCEAKESYSFLFPKWEIEEYCHLNNKRESFGSLPEKGKVVRLLRSQAKIKMKKKLKLLSKLKQNGVVDDEFIKVRLNAYKAHVKHANAHKLLYFYTKKNNL